MADLRRSTRWAGLRPGDPVQVEGTRLRGAAWEFMAHVTNGETGEAWVEVVGGRAGDRSVRSFRPGPALRAEGSSRTATRRWPRRPGSRSSDPDPVIPVLTTERLVLRPSRWTTCLR